MLKLTSTAAVLTITATAIFATFSAQAATKGTLPECKAGWKFVEEIANERAQRLTGASCKAGTAPAYYVCTASNRFGVRCLTPEDLAKAKSGK